MTTPAISVLETIPHALRVTVQDATYRLSVLNEPHVSDRPGPGRWSRKEILGHLIDSAANNHQRFVRAQEAEPAAMYPPYAQDHWVAVQGYQQARWQELIELWTRYNLHLARVIERIPPDRLGREVRIGTNPPVTLGYLVEDYLTHLEHHLRQIEG